MDFPTAASALLTIAGAAAFSSILGMWLKHYLPDWRFTNLLILGLALLASLSARLVLGEISGQSIVEALLIGLGGATLATFGYETVTNVAGMLGAGKRSDEELLRTARATVARLSK